MVLPKCGANAHFLLGNLSFRGNSKFYFSLSYEALIAFDKSLDIKRFSLNY